MPMNRNSEREVVMENQRTKSTDMLNTTEFPFAMLLISSYQGSGRTFQDWNLLLASLSTAANLLH